MSEPSRRQRKFSEPGAAWFEPFVDRDSKGRLIFQNRMRTGGTFLDRCWPVFRPVRRRQRRTHFGPSARHMLWSRAIVRASNIAAARRWIPENPLFAHVMLVEDAIHGRGPGPN